MINHCINCGSKLKEHYKYCRECGNKIPEQIPETISHCPDCGNKISENDKFCENCGFQVPIKIEKKDDLQNEEKELIAEPVVPNEIPEEKNLNIETEKTSRRKYWYLLGGIVLIILIAVIFADANGFFNNPPLASCSATPMTGLAPLTVSFTGSGSDTDGSITLYYWEFGDGAASYSQNPNHSYKNKGTYIAKLTVTDNDGKTNSESVTITVLNSLPIASCSASPKSGYVPLTVSFTGSGIDNDGNIVSYNWNFGDGTSSSSQNPSHTYQNTGTYNVQLTVADNDGATDSDSVTITVSAIPLPTASCSASPKNGEAPLTVFFTGTGSDIDGYITSYYWNFGDGATSSTQNPHHTYQNPGTFTARLTITDNDGNTYTDTVTITVYGPNQNPVASCTASPQSGIVPLLVSFTGSGTDPDGVISSYQWSFGDGHTSTEQNPSHTYTTAGVYTATLTVTDDRGKTNSVSVTIQVSSGESITGTFSPTDDVSTGATGDYTYMQVRNDKGFLGFGGYEWSVYIKFSISSIPSNAVIESATLHLYYYNWDDTNPSNRVLNLHRIWGQNWNEETIIEYQPGVVGQVTDYAIVPPNINTWMVWDVTEDVQNFVDGTYTNYGWKLMDETPWNNRLIPITSFRTKEYSSNYAPYLSVTYS